MISGAASINGQSLTARDGMGVWDTEELNISVEKDARILLMDVPMQLG